MSSLAQLKVPIWVRKSPSYLYNRIISGKLQIQPTDCAPRLENGKWRSPLLSCLDLAKLRKQFTIHQKDPKEFVPENVTEKICPWLYEPEQKVRLVVVHDPKGKAYRARTARKMYVEEAMKKMPEMIANWKAERAKQREAMKPKYPF